MSIVTNVNRVGRFTSSKFYCLMSKGKGKNDEFTVAGYKYINERYHERKLRRSLDTGAYSRDSAWGLFLESYVFMHFTDMKYQHHGDVTTINPENNNHSGSTDLLEPKVKVADVKCYQLPKFCRIAECFLLEDLQAFKRDFKEEFWQLVSNSIIHGVSRAELIVYIPTEDQLKDIRHEAENHDGPDQWKYRFIVESKNHELAYLPNGAQYNHIYRYEFEIPQEDIDLFNTRLDLAGKELQKLLSQNKKTQQA